MTRPDDMPDGTQAAPDEHALHPTTGEPLSPEALRALKEAEERRVAASQSDTARPVERDGPKGLEPTRYGDWEKSGITSDF